MLWAAAGAVVLVLLLLALLPSILSSTAVERLISRRVSSAVNAPFQIEGLSLGWFSPARVGSITLGLSPGAEPSASIEGIDLHQGLWALAMSKGSDPKLHIDSIHVAANRDAEGTIDWMRFVEQFASGDPPPEEEPSGPLQIPITSLDFHIGRVGVTWRDEATTQPIVASVLLEDLTALWPGAGQPLYVSVGGNITVQDVVLPLEFKARADDFIDEQQQPRMSASLDLSGHFAGLRGELHTASIESLDATGSLDINLGEFGPLIAALPLPAPAPLPFGDIALRLDSADEVGRNLVKLDLTTRGLGATGTPVGRVEIPDIVLHQRVALFPNNFEDMRGTGSFSTPGLSAEWLFDGDPSLAKEFTASIEGQLSLAQLLAPHDELLTQFAGTTRAAGEIDFSASAELRGMEHIDARAEIGIERLLATGEGLEDIFPDGGISVATIAEIGYRGGVVNANVESSGNLHSHASAVSIETANPLETVQLESETTLFLDPWLHLVPPAADGMILGGGEFHEKTELHALDGTLRLASSLRLSLSSNEAPVLEASLAASASPDGKEATLHELSAQLPGASLQAEGAFVMNRHASLQAAVSGDYEDFLAQRLIRPFVPPELLVAGGLEAELNAHADLAAGTFELAATGMLNEESAAEYGDIVSIQFPSEAMFEAAGNWSEHSFELAQGAASLLVGSLFGAEAEFGATYSMTAGEYAATMAAQAEFAMEELANHMSLGPVDLSQVDVRGTNATSLSIEASGMTGGAAPSHEAQISVVNNFDVESFLTELGGIRTELFAIAHEATMEADISAGSELDWTASLASDGGLGVATITTGIDVTDVAAAPVIIQLSALRFPLSANAAEGSPIDVMVEDAGAGETTIDLDMGLFHIPPWQLTADAGINLETQLAALREFTITSARGALSETTGQASLADFTFNLQHETRIPDVGLLDGLLRDVEGLRYISPTGSARMTADLSSPQAGIEAALPAAGTVSLAAGDIALNLNPQANISGLNARADIELAGEAARLSALASLDEMLHPYSEYVIISGARGELAMEALPNDSAASLDSSWSVTSLGHQGSLRAAVSYVVDPAAPADQSADAPLAIDAAIESYTNFAQWFPAGSPYSADGTLSADVTVLKEAGGPFDPSGVINLSGLSLEIPSLMSLSGANSRVPFGGYASVLAVQRPGGFFSINSLESRHPGITGGIRNLHATWSSRPGGFELLIQCTEFLRGSLSCALRLDWLSGGMRGALDATVRNLDISGVTALFPKGTRRRTEIAAEARGSILLRLGSIWNDLGNALTFYFRVSNLDKQLMQALLRMYDPEGAAPSTQSAYFALNAGKPVYADFQLEQGFASSRMKIATLVGAQLVFDLIKRQSISGLLQRYIPVTIDEDIAAALAMLRSYGLINPQGGVD